MKNFKENKLLSTLEFYEKLQEINFEKNKSNLKIFNVDFNPDEFETLLKDSSIFIGIENSDGLISHVKENPSANHLDYSQSSRYFLLHTDGQYLPKVPEIVFLHCKNPGTINMPTVFANTQDILLVLKEKNLLDQAKEYEFVFKNKNGLEFKRPLIEKYPRSNELVMNIAISSPQCRLTPFPGANKTQEDADVFYSLIGKIAKDNLKYIVHDWKKNDLVVFDNIRLVHGRGLPNQTKLGIPDKERHLHRIWLSRN